MEDYADFANWVRISMRARGLSGRQLAARSGVDHSTISRLLRSDRIPSYETARKLTQALQHDPTNTAAVEAVLRRDPVLDDTDVVRLMREYRRLRAERLTGRASRERSPAG